MAETYTLDSKKEFQIAMKLVATDGLDIMTSNDLTSLIFIPYKPNMPIYRVEYDKIFDWIMEE